MLRKSFIMFLKENTKAEYEKRHDEIWEELIKELKNRGVNNYSIFWEEDTNKLFAYVEIENEEKWNSIAKTEICQKWWKYMAPLMETNSDCSPKQKELTEVFHLD